MSGTARARLAGPRALLIGLARGRGIGNALARTASITAGGFLISSALKLGSNLVTTRFLAEQPEAFALMGVALVINTFVMMLSDVGIQSSIIRSDRGDDPRFLRTAWVTAIGRNTILFVLVLLGAAGVAAGQSADAFRPGSTLALPDLPLVISAVGSTLFVAGFTSANLALARRRMKAARITAVEIANQLASSAVTIALCAYGFGVWALVGGTVFAAFGALALSHLAMPGPRMAFRWNRDDFAELFSFGKWLLLASACGFVVAQADKLIFGYFFEANRLALYVTASIWVLAVMNLFAKVVQLAFYPALSQANRDDERAVTPTYVRLRLIVDGLCAATFVVLVLINEPLFALLYAPPFEDAARDFGILILAVLLLPYRLLNVLLLAKGDSRRFTAVTAVGALYTLTVVPTAFVMGSEALAVFAFAARNVVTAGTTVWLTRRIVPFSVLREGRMMAAFALGSAYILLQG